MSCLLGCFFVKIWLTWNLWFKTGTDWRIPYVKFILLSTYIKLIWLRSHSCRCFVFGTTHQTKSDAAMVTSWYCFIRVHYPGSNTSLKTKTHPNVPYHTYHQLQVQKTENMKHIFHEKWNLITLKKNMFMLGKKHDTMKFNPSYKTKRRSKAQVKGCNERKGHGKEEGCNPRVT